MKEARIPGSKEPSCVSLVEQTLEQADDFMTARQIVLAILTLHCRQVSAALSHLHKRRAADFIEADNAIWWFLTPETDTRCRKVETRVVEEPGHRKPRGTTKKK